MLEGLVNQGHFIDTSNLNSSMIHQTKLSSCGEDEDGDGRWRYGRRRVALVRGGFVV